jgi:predicted nuclease of predicted toxin-antitoxin system
MKFLLDENLGKEIAEFLKKLGFAALSIRKIAPGIDDYEVLSLAVSQNAILITQDRDFGELVFKEEHAHKGIIFRD